MKMLWHKDKPIIEHLLETDTYKIFMLYFIWKFFPQLDVVFTFTNRTRRVRLAEEIDVAALREQLAHVQLLRFDEAELRVLRELFPFPDAFIRALRELRLPPVNVSVTENGQLSIVARSRWFDVTLWELIVLPIVSELRARAVFGNERSNHRRVIAAGEERLRAKADALRHGRWPILLFDLRRRLSGAWERHTSKMLLELLPERIAGVSNVRVAQELGVPARGTNAHELPMALTALRAHESAAAMRRAQVEVLEKWEELYGARKDLLIMLPDTYGSAQFFDAVGAERLRRWRGVRQDSGDPVAFGEAIARRWQALHVNPREKLILFSDGLTPQKMSALEERFSGRVSGGFGWGTNKGNDVPGLAPLSLVMKLTAAAGNPAVKLSDNIAKSTGAPDAVDLYKDVFGYTESLCEEAVY